MVKFDRYIGIDCGRGGAIAHISQGSIAKTVSMPETVDDLNAFFIYLKSISENPIACVEKVSLWRGDAVAGKAFGIEKLTRNLNEITTLLRVTKIPYIMVLPIQWQAYLKLSGRRNEKYDDRKRRFKRVAAMHFPGVPVTLTNCDALLIMEFLAFKMQREPEWVTKKIPDSIIKTLEL